MKQRVELNGDWSLTWSAFGGQLGGWIPATVPGDVHQDMVRAGLLPDPYRGMNADVHRSLENWDWIYRHDFAAPALAEGQRAFLVFEGIDTFANVFLNGVEIARNENMWTPIRADVTELLKPGEPNKIIVRIAPATDPDLRNEGGPRTLVRKAQFNFGWDIAPRLVSAGLWQPVFLEIVDRARISDLYFRTKRCSAESAELAACVEVEAFDPGFAGELQLDVFAPEGAKVAEFSRPATPGPMKIAFKVSPAQLWWPNTNGPQPLYRARVSLTAGGAVLDRQEQAFGIRTVELIAGDAQAADGGFFFRVNGKRLFMKGFNWTPADSLPGTITAERYRTLLDHVRDCNANMLRVWGGGLYEPDLFYELCTERGILIWQDFMFACGHYPSDAKFLREVRREGELVVRRLRRHTCRALWCGGNENDAMHGGGSHAPGWRVLGGVCRRLDPDTAYIPDSPVLPRGAAYSMPAHGRDAHAYWHREGWQVPLTDTSDFMSECGKLGLPDLATLRQCMPEDKLWPPTNEYWLYHVSDTERIGFRYRVQCLLDAIRNSGLPEPHNIEEFIERSQECQARFLTRMIEHYAGLPNCGGLLFWNVYDCWPQISDALLAHNLTPKKAYAAVQAAYRKIP